MKTKKEDYYLCDICGRKESDEYIYHFPKLLKEFGKDDFLMKRAKLVFRESEDICLKCWDNNL